MQTPERNELYTDKGNYAVMTRTSVITYAQIAGQLCRNIEHLAASGNPDCGDRYCIAGTMLGWTYNPAPLCIDAALDY
jgi:protein involved in ribonucleotide reduction